MAYGNGAYILHKDLENNIPGYVVAEYSPYLTIAPFLLKTVPIPRKIDLIHSTPDYACFFGCLKTPQIITFHNYVLDNWMKKYSSLLQSIHYKTGLKFFTKQSINRAHTLTAVSKYTANVVQQDLGINKPIKVIYNGIDANKFTPCIGNKKLLKNKINILFSGNLTRRKGVQWLPSIANKLSKNIVLHATSGLKPIHKSINNINALGSILYSDMPQLYNTMDILIMPTVREGFGLAVAEAMACGLPVVATNCSAIPELIDHGKGGFLCNIGDTKDFAEKINILAESPKLRHEMGEYNRSKIELQFTLKRMVREYQNLFEAILSLPTNR
ncbi:glycosyl transferases group 1 [Desulfoluna spongiiphila]|nr:glycosyl transferases group 1 [Desulfoluna spongiiphila]